MSSGKEHYNISEALLDLKVPVDSITLLERNPRKGDVDAVVKSYERFGQQKPIVIDKNSVVIAGNHQLLAAIKLGWTHIAVVRTQLEGQEALGFALADNRTSELGFIDEELLSEILMEFDDKLREASGYMDWGKHEVKALDEQDGDGQVYNILIECTDEWQQGELLEELVARGLNVRPFRL